VLNTRSALQFYAALALALPGWVTLTSMAHARLPTRVADALAHPLSREQAVALVEKRFHARAVRVDVVEESGRRVFSIRLLSGASKIWTVRVDAATGQIK
jgi:uncharacterized membrane protein YkoI